MRASATLLIVLLSAGVAVAQETAPPPEQDVSSETRVRPQPDYSRDTLLRLVREHEEEKERENVRFSAGAVEFRALGTRWRFNYLPIMAPISGTRLGITNEWPDPFALTGTSMPYTPRTWQTRRQVNSELRRINESEKKRARIKVDVKSD